MMSVVSLFSSVGARVMITLAMCSTCLRIVLLHIDYICVCVREGSVLVLVPVM